MSGCIFCRIARGEMKAELLARSEGLVAFRDINPKAPVHVLIVPEEHVESSDRLEGDGHERLAGRMVMLAAEVARKLGVAEGGYRLVMNCGADGGQAVPHIHLHLLGGRSLSWPPG